MRREELYCGEVLDQLDGSVAGSSVPAPASQDYLTGIPPAIHAYKDPVILEDSRVFHNMLEIEEFYIAATNYFQAVQSEILPHMRKMVTDWMLEVCLDQRCHVDVFLLSCNIMDRFLSQIEIKKSQFQLVAAATMFISSKLVDPCPISGNDLVKYTDKTYNLTELLEMELLILSKLKWDLSAVTPYDFLEYLVRLLCMDGDILRSDLARNDLLKHTKNLIILCATEFRFSMYPPSMLSSAALTTSANTLGTQVNVEALKLRLQLLTRVENVCLNDCIYQIEKTFQENHMQQLGGETRMPITPPATPSQETEDTVLQEFLLDNQIEPKPTITTKENSIYTNGDATKLKSPTPTDVLDLVGRL